MRYTLSRSKLFGIGLFLVGTLFPHGEINAVAATSDTIMAYEYAELNNCVIPAGSSTCVATLAVYAPSGRTYTVRNITRGIISSNIITPNNYVLYTGGYAYVLNNTPQNDAANRLTYGNNYITIIQAGSVIPSLSAVANASCATGSNWNGQLCATSSTPPTSSGTTTSIVTLKSGNGDTVYSFDLPKNISKDYYTASQVEKKVSFPSTTSVINITLSSTKDRCSINPNFTTDSGIDFTSGSKDYMKSDLQSVTMMLPIYAALASSSNTLYGRISSISISCDNYNDVVRDFIIFRINFLTPLPPTIPTELHATNCTIASGKSTCISTVSVTPDPDKYYNLENSTRGLTLTNAFRQGVSSISTSTLGEQAANYISYGTNTLNLKDGTTVVSSIQATATCGSGLAWNGQTCGSPPPPPPTGQETLTIHGCSIAIGSSVCTSIASIANMANNKFYDLYNETTGITTSNAFYLQNQYYFDPKYAGSASELKYGSNTLRLRSASERANLASAVINIGCVTGSSWNGQICIAGTTNPPPNNANVTIEARNCTIPAGKSICPSTVLVTSTKYIGTTGGRTFDLKNATRNLTSTNLFTPNSTTLNSAGYPVYTVGANSSGDAANYATNGVNDLVLIEGGVSVLKATVTASCATGSAWNGQMCAETGPIACTAVVKFCDDGSIMPRDPNCGWHPEQCSIDQGINLTSYMIGNVTTQLSPAGFPMIELPEASSITFMGTARPGSTVYFYRVGSSDIISVVVSTSGQWSLSTSMSSTKKVLLSGTNSYTFGTVPPTNLPQTSLVGGTSNSIVIGDPYSVNVTIKVIPTISPAPVLTISCSKPSYAVGEEASCKISGGTGIKTCWQTGTSTTQATACTQVGWAEDGDLYFYKWVSASMVGNYTIYAKDATGKTVSTQVSYTNSSTPALPHIEASNCTIASGKSTCISTVTIIPTPDKYYNLENSTRGLTLTSAFRPNIVTISTSVLGEQAANYLTYGSNTLKLKDGTNVLSTIQATANCVTGTTWNGQLCTPEVTPPNNANVTIEARNCTIPAGKSICPSTVLVTSTKYIGTTGGRTFDLKNATRNLTSTNLFTPNSTTLNSAGYPVYTVGANSSGDAANYATNGVNDLVLIEGGVSVLKATVTASCATGSAWNGQMCATPGTNPPAQSGGTIPPTQTGGTILPTRSGGTIPVNPTAKMANCVIPQGESTCSSTLFVFAQSGQTFTVKNVTRNIVSENAITPNNYYVVSGKGVYILRANQDKLMANQLVFGVNMISVTQNGVLSKTFRTRAIARCDIASTWNGSKCVSKIPTAFSVKTYETARGVKTFSKLSGITFDPILDQFLTLRGVGPVGTVEMYQGGGTSGVITGTADNTGKWKLTMNAENTPMRGEYDYIIWDGKNASTSTVVAISIVPGTRNPIDPLPPISTTNTPGTSGGSSGSGGASNPSILPVEMVTLGS